VAEVVADVEVEVAVAVDVGGRRAGGPVVRRALQPGVLGGHVGEAPAVVAEELVGAEVRDQQVLVAVAVVVEGQRAEAVAARDEPASAAHSWKRRSPRLRYSRAAQSPPAASSASVRAARVRVGAALREEEVEVAVGVEVERGHAGPDAVEQEELALLDGRAGEVAVRDAALGARVHEPRLAARAGALVRRGGGEPGAAGHGRGLWRGSSRRGDAGVGLARAGQARQQHRRRHGGHEHDGERRNRIGSLHGERCRRQGSGPASAG
jgi:hypothetical protein